MPDPVTLEIGRIVQLTHQRGESTARMILADDIVKLRAANQSALRKLAALIKQWQQDGCRGAVQLAFHKRICEQQDVCECSLFINIAIPAAAQEIAEKAAKP